MLGKKVISDLCVIELLETGNLREATEKYISIWRW